MIAVFQLWISKIYVHPETPCKCRLMYTKVDYFCIEFACVIDFFPFYVVFIPLIEIPIERHGMFVVFRILRKKLLRVFLQHLLVEE